MAIVLLQPYCGFVARWGDRCPVMERGEVVTRGRGDAMADDRVRERMSI